MINELTNIGLTQQESIVYLSLLKQREQQASILAKKTKINRSVIYSILSNLIEKGLTSHVIKNNIKYFSATSPERLLEFLKDKEKTLSNLLPKLKKIKENKPDKVSVELYQGRQGGISILKDIIKTGKDYLVLGEDGTFEKRFPVYIKQYIRQLKEKKIKERILAKENVKIKTTKNSRVKYLPKEFQMPTITTIYGDKVAIAIFTEPFYTILIRSKDLTKSYKSFFEILWKVAK
jgi:sugar-specific transcriptional regulator TrmB